MTESSFGARPHSETFEYAGATVELVDAATILAAARVNPVELLRRAMWPAPVQRVDLAVSSADIGGGPKHVFTAEISTADEPLTKERIRALVLGSDPVGVLLAKRIAAGDPVATRIVDGVGAAAAAAYKRLGLDRAQPAAHRQPATLADAVVGLQATVTYDESGTKVRLRAEVPRDDVQPAHLQAFAGLMLQAVVEVAGPDSLRGRRYVISRDSVTKVPTTTQTVTLDQVGGLADLAVPRAGERDRR
jgi:transitional endoplasmic reticulum ATPase